MATVFEKSWSSVVGVSCPLFSTAANALRSNVWNYVQFLLGRLHGAAPAGAWTVYASCDSVTAGVMNDGVDRWGAVFDATKIVRAAAGSAHSWFVLKSPAILGSSYYCIVDVSGASENYLALLTFCKAAPTGGSVTARPTSTDEWGASGVSGQDWADGTATNWRLNGSLCTDGTFVCSFTKVGLTAPSVGKMLLAVATPLPGDAYPVASYSYYGAALGMGSANAGSTSSWRGYANGAVSVLAAVSPRISSTYALSATYFPTGTDALTGYSPDFPVYLIDTTANFLKGRLPDIYWGAEGLGSGATEPGDGVPVAALLGALWVPFQSAPIL